MLKKKEFYLILIIANFILFCVKVSILGGDAVNGYENSGKYFLKAQSSIVEVSESVFYFSYIYTIITFFSIITFLIVVFIYRKK